MTLRPITGLLVLSLLMPAAWTQAQRIYDSSGRALGGVDGDRLYSVTGSLMGRIDDERLYDGSGRQIGRADGLRRMQMFVFFYFFM